MFSLSIFSYGVLPVKKYTNSLLQWKIIITALCFLTLSACSSTHQLANENLSSSHYSNGFVRENFSHMNFTENNKVTVKKPLNSDHELMMSLLNRPMTEDQQMMLAFTAQRSALMANDYDGGIEIKGEKFNEHDQTDNFYYKLIVRDINAVNITAPD